MPTFTQSTDFSGSLDFSSPDTTWIVNSNVIGQALAGGYVVSAKKPNPELINHGTLQGAVNGATVFFDRGADGNKLFNDGLITGDTAYLTYRTDGCSLENLGSLVGTLNAVQFGEESGNVKIENSGSIIGINYDGLIFDFTSTANITNLASGSITGTIHGISIWQSSNVSISNSGTISGDSVGVFSGDETNGTKINNLSSGSITSPGIALVTSREFGVLTSTLR